MSSGDGSSSSSLSIAVAFSVTMACGVLGTLIALQTDAVSRKMLSCEKLYAKRHAEYRYYWNTALEKAGWMLRYARFGSSNNYNADDEILRTLFVRADSDLLDELVDKIVKNQLANVRVGRIDKDERQPHSMEYYIWLLYDNDDDDDKSDESNSNSMIYQVPLTSFVCKMSNAFERKITSTTFCFVVDASANVASQLVVDLMNTAETKQQQHTAAAAAVDDRILTLQQPLWLVNLAEIARKRTVSQSTLEQTLFSLCRLEALNGGGGSSNSSTRHTTIATCLITVGTAMAPTLLPLLYKVFPNDRHVFAYTGCCNTIEYAQQQKQKDSLPRSYIPPSVQQALTWNQKSILYNTPFTGSLYKSTNVMKPFQQALQQLTLSEARVVETWMGAVDAFFTLKHTEKEYLPYVLKLDYLLESSLDQYLSLRSLLQYVKGTRSREIPKDTMNKSLRWLIDYMKILPPLSSSSSSSTKTATDLLNKEAIENAVFQHKLILIENKTLQDTVQPAEHWTLKQAMKRGCACCAPEDDEDEEEEEERQQQQKSGGGMTSFATMATTGRNALTSTSFLPKSMLTTTEAVATTGPTVTTTTTSGSTTTTTSKSGSNTKTGYVDGKTAFAFDPTRFNTST